MLKTEEVIELIECWMDSHCDEKCCDEKDVKETQADFEKVKEFILNSQKKMKLNEYGLTGEYHTDCNFLLNEIRALRILSGI